MASDRLSVDSNLSSELIPVYPVPAPLTPEPRPFRLFANYSYRTVGPYDSQLTHTYDEVVIEIKTLGNLKYLSKPNNKLFLDAQTVILSPALFEFQLLLYQKALSEPLPKL